MNNKSLIVSKQSFFSKLKSFFRNIFEKYEFNKPVYNDVPMHNYEENKNEDIRKRAFEDNIRVRPDYEKEKLLKMQRDYEAGLIKEEDMTEEQVSGIEKLYKEQISKLRNDYREYKVKATSLRKKLVTSKA